MSNPNEPVEVGFFDTVPEHDGPVFSGCWGVFPFSPEHTGARGGVRYGHRALRAPRGGQRDPSGEPRRARALDLKCAPGGDDVELRRVRRVPRDWLLFEFLARAEPARDRRFHARRSLAGRGGRGTRRRLRCGGRLVQAASERPALQRDDVDHLGRARRGGSRRGGRCVFLRVSDGERTESRRVVLTSLARRDDASSAANTESASKSPRRVSRSREPSRAKSRPSRRGRARPPGDADRPPAAARAAARHPSRPRFGFSRCVLRRPRLVVQDPASPATSSPAHTRRTYSSRSATFVQRAFVTCDAALAPTPSVSPP